MPKLMCYLSLKVFLEEPFVFSRSFWECDCRIIIVQAGTRQRIGKIRLILQNSARPTLGKEELHRCDPSI